MEAPDIRTHNFCERYQCKYQSGKWPNSHCSAETIKMVLMTSSGVVYAVCNTFEIRPGY